MTVKHSDLESSAKWAVYLARESPREVLYCHIFQLDCRGHVLWQAGYLTSPFLAISPPRASSLSGVTISFSPETLQRHPETSEGFVTLQEVLDFVADFYGKPNFAQTWS